MINQLESLINNDNLLPPNKCPTIEFKLKDYEVSAYDAIAILEYID
jgi:hypothetical protein